MRAPGIDALCSALLIYELPACGGAPVLLHHWLATAAANTVPRAIIALLDPSPVAVVTVKEAVNALKGSHAPIVTRRNLAANEL